MRTLLIVLTIAIAGCESSVVWYANHPERQVVKIDGFDITVVPRGGNKYDALGGLEGLKTNMAAVRDRHIRAIETVTKCKVTGAEFITGTDISQTLIRCA